MVGQIKFTIDEQGEVSIDVQGAQGSECDTWTKPFEEALGTVSKKEQKDSYYQESNENQTQNQ